MRRLAPASFLLASLLLFNTAPAEASIILFSNLGAGGTYFQPGGWTISGASSGAGDAFTQGSPFVPVQTATLDVLEAGLSFLSGVNAFDLSIRTDVGGLPGTTLETFHLTNLPVLGSSNNTLATGTSLLHPLLTAGVQYWVIAAPSDTTTWGAFNFTSTADTGHASQVNGGSFTADSSTAGAFQVSGTLPGGGVPVPEPMSLLLLGSGLIGAGVRRYRRKKS